MSDADIELVAQLRALAGVGVEFVVIGGLAVMAHGYIRATEDADVVADPAPQNLARLSRVLREIEADLPGADPAGLDPTSVQALSAGANSRFMTRHGLLHVVQSPAGGLSYRELREEAIEAPLEKDLVVVVCSYEHLVTMKRASGRPMDLIDLEALERAREE